MFAANVGGFLEWKEVFISQVKGSRVVHYYFTDTAGNSILAVVGTERSLRHMVYVVADEFYQLYGTERNITAGFKWRSKREVVEWLTSSLLKQHPPQDVSISPNSDPRQASGSSDYLRGFDAPRDHPSDPRRQIVGKPRGNSSDIFWSGDSWTCSKQLTHYPAFCRNGITIGVHSFVFVMAKEDSHYLAYLEDMYEDRKGQKKVRARWFHDNREVASVVTLPKTHSREVFITPHAQVISAECVDGPATVLTAEHYEKCLVALPHVSSATMHVCSRQFKKNKIKPFDVTKLRGYYFQKALLSLEELEDLGQGGTLKQGAKRSRSCRGRESFVTSSPGVKVSAQRSMITASEPTDQNLKFGVLGGRPPAFKYCEPNHSPFKVDAEIEVLSQDSGIRGCWFKCTILQLSRKKMKVQYDDLQDVDECGNLEEWIPAFRLAAPDKLGMRCSGRLTIRPRPHSQDIASVIFEIGSPVDAQWYDGWWEGVVTGIDDCGNDSLQVYFPGEDKFSTFQRKNLRISRDWVKNQWVDIGARPDILSVISADVSPGMKLSACSTVAKRAESGSSGMSEREVPTVLVLDTVEENKQERSNLNRSDDHAENMEWVKSNKQLNIEDESKGGDNGDENETGKAEDKGKGRDTGHEDQTDIAEDKDVNGVDDDEKDKMEEDTETAEHKCEPEAAGLVEVAV
ncbi:Agenet domain-containing protein / bromo-adjacent domain-containing protein [Thalictrum thalictroides]|uniref:Agenet domain-containing protein / bromo-adjacent domain-containing protein n=1 Tax=Thalictrum thalictroides TaxID=46969 RepID=A0A7J6WMY4_THATH|nr:Agenet domain-containing protein / bromo-adjacent domain-containing protein [Thalictrum thalictroides]